MIEHIHFNRTDNVAHVAYKFSDDDMKVMMHLEEHGYIEFKNGADSIVNDLCDAGFVTYDDDAWHPTYILTALGNRAVHAMIKN